jgi:signal transduction histidine kinase
MWRKVVVELLTNAVKFSNPESQIVVTLSTTGGECLFMVTDEGIGIPADDIDRVFGIFDRGENVENIPGAGLGLAIVKQTMERHQGTVEITSEMGKGTTVTLRLPKYVLEGVR